MTTDPQVDYHSSLNSLSRSLRASKISSIVHSTTCASPNKGSSLRRLPKQNNLCSNPCAISRISTRVSITTSDVPSNAAFTPCSSKMVKTSSTSVALQVLTCVRCRWLILCQRLSISDTLRILRPIFEYLVIYNLASFP